MMCFTRTAVALLLSLYTVVFIKMSLGFNKGVPRQLFPVLKFALMFQKCARGKMRSHLWSVCREGGRPGPGVSAKKLLGCC